MKLTDSQSGALEDDQILSAIAAGSAVYIIALDLDFRITYMSRAAGGLDKEKLIGSRFFDTLTDQDQQSRINSCFESVLKTSEPETVTNQVRSQDGSNSHWSTRVAPIIENDAITGLILFSENVTKNHQTRSERDLVFELSDDLMCVLSFSGYFTRVNPAFSRKLGFEENHFLSNHYSKLIHPDDIESSKAAFSDTTEHNLHLPAFQNRYLKSDGGYLTIQWSGTVDPVHQCVIAIGRDVTRSREIETQLLRSQKMEAVGQLAGGVAHDFNNLLMAMSANCELGLMVDDLPSIKKRLKDIEAATNRAAELTHKLLTFSRNQPMRMTIFDLNATIEGLLKLIKRVIPENIDIDFYPATELPQLHADKGQIEQAVMNLCLNARDSMQSGGQIAISTASAKIDSVRAVSITVQDTGGGIDKETMDYIFNPFFSTKSEAHGTGLGLSTTLGIIEKHHGQISVSETGPAGTTMTVTLPILEQSGAMPSLSDTDKRGKETILLAEDDAMVSKAAAGTLNQAGYQVVIAADGEDAVEQCLSNHAISLAFLDIVMPKLNGPEAADRIRKQKPDFPIMFATGYSPSQYEELAERYPLLHKPYRGDELLIHVKQLLSAS